jgi:putative mRNA 3-end processing factor
MTLNLQKYIKYLLKIDTKQKLHKDLTKIYEESKEFSNNYKDPYYVCSNEDLLEIFNTSWSGVQEEPSESTIFYALSLYWFDAIEFELYRSILQELHSHDKLPAEILVTSYWMYWKKQRRAGKPSKYSFYSFLELTRKLGIEPIEFQDFYTKTKELFSNLKISEKELEIGNDLSRLIKNIQDRPQYLEEFSSSINPETMRYLDFFADYQTLSDLAYFYVKSISNNIELDKKISIANFQKKVEEEFKTRGMKPVPTVVDPILQPHLSNFDPKTVSMEELAHLQKEQMKEFASIKAYSSPKSAQKIRISFLGGGNIGNMGILVQHDNNAILLDFGMSVANYSTPRWHPSLKYVKAVLVTHAHLDHTGGLPYLIRPEDGKRWYATQSTKILAEKLLYSTSSILRSNGISKKNATPFQQAYLSNSNIVNLFNVFNPLKINETVEVSPGFKVTPYSASHLYGSVSYKIDVFGKTILFTGDFSADKSELFDGAKIPTDCDVTIFDGTYYGRSIEDTDPNTVILQAAETCERLIIPAFSVGRTQEMIKRLERLRISTKRSVKTTGMSADVSKSMGLKAKFDIVKNLSSDNFENNDIAVTGHGMLQGGAARKLVDETSSDDNTGILICGYQAPNTLGYSLKNGHSVALKKYNQKVFSAHISGHSGPESLNDFIDSLSGKKIMVHTPDDTVLRDEHKDMIIPKYNQEIVLKNKI